MKIQLLIPQIITSIRLICSPFLFYTIYENLQSYAIIWFLIIVITDLIDGVTARKLNVITSFGGFFDAFTDFIVIMFGFSAFILLKIFPYWLLILFTVHFLFFIFTSKRKKLIYDTIGKYYGAFLIAIIGITLIFMDFSINSILTVFVVIVTILVFLSRILFLKKC